MIAVNPPKCDGLDYIQFLVAAQDTFTCTEAARCQPGRSDTPAHDAFTRLLKRQPPDTEALWQEAEPFVERNGGLLVVDDTTLDKPYARQMDLVTRHWSGKHHRVVQGINLTTLLWTDGESLIPTDCRVYHKEQDGLTKNDHLRAMLKTAVERDFHPRYVVFDGWYSGVENLKAIRSYGWLWLTRLKGNRQVNPDRTGNRAVETVFTLSDDCVVHLKDYGMVRVFRIVATDGETEYWATNDLTMTESDRLEWARQAWGIESYHRGIKQCCGIERSQVRGERAIRNHLLFSLRAFLRLEVHWMRTRVSWYEAKQAIVRDAIRRYLAHPRLLLDSTA